MNLSHTEIVMPDYGLQTIQEAWGDVLDIRREQADEWQQQGWGTYGQGYSTGRSDDRRGGSYRPVYESESDLDDLRAVARVVADCTEAGVNALLNLTNYVIGSGFTYKVVTQKGSAGDEQLAAQVEFIVEEFLEQNCWYMERERELFRRSRRDGEYFLGLWNEDGHCKVRIIDPERIREPSGAGVSVNPPTFGIETEEGDIESVTGYWVLWDELVNEPEWMDVSEIMHLKLNVDSNIKRGVSDFYVVGSGIQNTRKLLRNMVRGGSVQSAIAYIVQHVAGVTQSSVESMRSTNATQSYTQPYQYGGSRTRYAIEDKSGTRIDVPKGQEYKGSPLGNGEAANAFIAILQAGLRSIGSRWCMPEYMISGDASNANYSSTREAGTPFVKNCETEQQCYAEHYRRIVWRAVKMACEAGRIKAGYQQVRAAVDLQVEPPAIVVRDPAQETQRRSILHDKGILSADTWSAQEGLDPEEERANGAQRFDTAAGMPPSTAGEQPGVSIVDKQAAQPAAEPPRSEVKQIPSALAIVQAVAAGDLPRDSGIGQLEVMFGFTPDQAEKIMGSVGKGFVPKAEPEPEPEPVQESANDRLQRAANILWNEYP